MDSIKYSGTFFAIKTAWQRPLNPAKPPQKIWPLGGLNFEGMKFEARPPKGIQVPLQPVFLRGPGFAGKSQGSHPQVGKTLLREAKNLRRGGAVFNTRRLHYTLVYTR
jgi:hypothetical protein